MKMKEYLEKLGARGKRHVQLSSRKNYFKMKSGVVAVVIHEGKILLGKKRSDSSKFLAGRWHIPGETIEIGEDDKGALIRGIREEAGIGIYVGDYIGKSLSPSHHELRWYECFAPSDKIIAGSDLEDVQWVSKNTILPFLDLEVKQFWSKEIVNYFIS
jgi:ADP-ribose pyrophosphatase YjhB (NUDIX family)